MTRRISAVTFAVLLFSSLITFAQAPQAPKPAPELKNLNYFAGNWKMAGEVKPGPMGPGGKIASTYHIEWQAGKFFLVGHSQDSGAMGPGSGIFIYGYDTEKKAYTYDEFNSTGEAVHATGTLDGKVWTWTNDSTMDGKAMKGRFVVTEDSPTAYSFKFDMSQDGGQNWTPVMEGTGKKSAAGAATKK